MAIFLLYSKYADDVLLFEQSLQTQVLWNLTYGIQLVVFGLLTGTSELREIALTAIKASQPNGVTALQMQSPVISKGSEIEGFYHGG